MEKVSCIFITSFLYYFLLFHKWATRMGSFFSAIIKIGDEIMKEIELSKNVFVVKASVVNFPADAIVNAANKTLLGGGGVDGAIHQAAGPNLLEACKKLDGCDTGEAKITPSFDLKTCKYIIHTVGPVFKLSQNPQQQLQSCYKKSLDLALEYKCNSVAFSGISTGVYGYPVKQAASVASEAVAEWLKRHNFAIKVFLCCYKESEFEAYAQLVRTTK